MTTLQLIATLFFLIALIHTFMASKLERFAGRNFFWHLMAEVEVVFGFWSILFLISMIFIEGPTAPVTYVRSLNYTEAFFVFVIMCVAATRPVIHFAEGLIRKAARLLPFEEKMSFYISTLIVGPVLGSFITEPAAMTLTALILLETFYNDRVSQNFKYATLGLLFVNVSIGGTLTHFAAPPVLMVAGKWGWGTAFMFGHFGYKALVAIFISTAIYTAYFRQELRGNLEHKKSERMNIGVILFHLLCLFLVVFFAHEPMKFAAVFLVFLIFVKLTKKFQDDLKIKTSFLVGFFLAGLITLGNMQEWWLRPLISVMDDLTLFMGATALTAITDNAALTYLGSLVELGDTTKYALVAGAVAGGGLTVIANAPNPAGYGILKSAFGEEGISPLKLLTYALIPTLVGMLCFMFLPGL